MGYQSQIHNTKKNSSVKLLWYFSV